MRRCRPFRRRPRVTVLALWLACLGVGVASFPMTTQAEPLSEKQTEASEETGTRQTQEAALYGQAPTVESIDPIAELPDLREHPAGPQRKQAFLALLVPIIEAENARIAAQRDWLEMLKSRDTALTAKESARLASLCEDYGLACRGGNIPGQLLARVDTVPLSLVVIQAVEESGWGTSRFARQGNNLFGLRCFGEGCGLAQRGSGRHYSTFDSVQQAVRTYLHNLNTHRAYRQLRERRARLAEQGGQVAAEALIGALDGYAVREDYQDVLLSLLRTNGRLIERHRSGEAV